MRVQEAIPLLSGSPHLVTLFIILPLPYPIWKYFLYIVVNSGGRQPARLFSLHTLALCICHHRGVFTLFLLVTLGLGRRMPGGLQRFK